MTSHLRLSSTRTQVTNVDKDVEKREPSYSARGVPTGVATMGSSMEVSQNTKNNATIWPSNSTPGYTPKNILKMLIWKDTCTLMFIIPLFTAAKIWKQPKCPYIDEVIKKMCNTYTMEYYSVKKKRMKFCIFSNMDGLGGFMLTEVSQKKTNIVCFHLHMETKNK